MILYFLLALGVGPAAVFALVSVSYVLDDGGQETEW